MRNKWLLGVFVFHTLFKPGDYFRILVWTATKNYMLENINDQTVICRIAIFKPRQTKKFIWYWFVHFCVEATKKTISDKSDYKAWLILNTAWYGHAIKWRYWSRVEADFWQIQELSWLWSGHLVDNRMLPKLHCAARRYYYYGRQTPVYNYFFLLLYVIWAETELVIVCILQNVQILQSLIKIGKAPVFSMSFGRIWVQSGFSRGDVITRPATTIWFQLQAHCLPLSSLWENNCYFSFRP